MRKGFHRHQQRRKPGRLDLELELLRQIHSTPSRARKQQLITDLMHVGEWAQQIRSVARRWRQPGIDPEEMYLQGVMGWLEAVQRFDPKKGAGWVGYATMWVFKRCEELCRRQGCIVVETDTERRRARATGAQRRSPGWSSLDKNIEQ